MCIRCKRGRQGNPLRITRAIDQRESDAAALLLLGRTWIESTVRYLGVEFDDALEIAEKIDV
jgi:hypothetical protein